MMRSNMLRAALGGVALLLGLAEARADYPITASTAAANAQLTLCGFSVSNVVMPCHVIVDSAKNEMFKAANPGMVGLVFGGSALTLGQKSKAGSLPVALPLDPDILNAAATITAADAASTTATGQNSVSVVSGTPTTGSVYSYAVNGQSEADFTVTGTFTGTLVFEGSANNSLTWTPRSAHVMGTKYRTSTITAPGIFHINAAGLTNIRVRATALASGTPSVQLNTTSSTGSIYVMNPIELTDNTTGLSASIKAGGTAAPSDPALTVQDPTVAAAIAASSAGSGAAGAAPPNGATNLAYFQRVAGLDSSKASCRLPVSAASTNLNTCGSGAKTITHIRFCNLSTSVPAVLRLYNAASATVGTTAVASSIGAPPGQCAWGDWPEGYVFGTALSYSLTAGDGDADTTAVGAGQVKWLNIDTIN